MRDYPKHVKQSLRELAATAYQRELGRELGRLEESFAEWRRGGISAEELSERINAFATGTSRELSRQYSRGFPDLNVAYALAGGILSREEVPADVLDAIQHMLSFYRTNSPDSAEDRNGG